MTILLAMLLDAALGEPDWLWSRLRHPVVMFGQLIGRIETDLNKGKNRRAKGAMLLVVLVLGGALSGLVILALPFAEMWEVLIGAALIAHRSLADHVSAVADALRLSVADGRMTVARIVGRDVRESDEPSISRAAIESAAENFSDGVVAPIFWFLLLGLPGLIIYKLVNTADSMIGYRNDRFEEFGFAAARFDDILNWIPARLSALLILAISNRLDVLKVVQRDAALHRSPNAGWPEAALAQVLDVALAGPRSYDGQAREFPFVHPEGNRFPGAPDIDRSVALLWRAWIALFILVALIAVL